MLIRDVHRGLLILVALVAGAQSSKILAIFHFHSKSHFVMMEALAKGLANTGHDVTVVSHFPQKTPIPNYRDISLEGTVPAIVNNMSAKLVTEQWRSFTSVLDFIWRTGGVEMCRKMYETPQIQELLKSEENFDLLITELWGSDCFLPLSYKFRVPHISLITTMEVPWCLDRYGTPFNPSYQVNHFTDYSTSGLSFRQRILNLFMTAYLKLGHYIYSEIPTDRVARNHLKIPFPHLSEITKESSLLFVNSHFSLIGSRPLTPNVVEVGGLHIQNPKPLPEDLKKFLDEAKDGVILFSLGSLIKADTMEESVVDTFVRVFRRLPQRVLWKYSGKVIDQPENLKTVSWIPQSDILRHENVRLFITHGGLMGTQEAVAAGVPMLGIPFFADQSFNLHNYREKGFAVVVELEDVSEERIQEAISILLTDPRYRENARKYSRMFLDRPQSALDTAIYWTEYVLRYNGTKHLRSAAVDLTFVQYHLLDVGLFLVLVVVCLFLGVARGIAKCFPRGQRKKKVN